MTSMAKIKKETIRHIKAYEFWARTGEGSAGNKALQAVADQFSVSLRAVKSWYSSFGWRKRFESLSEKIIAEEARRTEEIVLLTHTRYREIIAKLVDKFEANFSDGNVDMTKVPDFEKLARLDLLMQGERTGDETQIVIVTAVPRPENPISRDQSPVDQSPVDQSPVDREEVPVGQYVRISSGSFTDLIKKSRN